MNHHELLVHIRAELTDGNHLDAWELALTSKDAVAIAYVESHAPITMASDPCGSCGGAGKDWECPYCRPDGLCWETMIFVGDCFAAEWHPPASTAESIAYLTWEGLMEPSGDGSGSPWAIDVVSWPTVLGHIIDLLVSFVGLPVRCHQEHLTWSMP